MRALALVCLLWAGPVWAQDADLDGLTDEEEVLLGTNPDQADTDMDGLSDGLEVGRAPDAEPESRTDPLNEDTDGDGLLDGEEDIDANGDVNGGETDPNLSDTDGGGTDDGREREDGTDPRDGVDDLERDRDGDGLTGREELALGTSNLTRDTDGDGLDDNIEIGNEPDADPATRTDPTERDTDQDGVVDGVEDANHDGAVGEGETDPLRADTDNGGTPDGQERVDGTNPLLPFDDLDADADGDGLSGRRELALQTDPNDGDTDDDGLGDLAEVLGFTDPLNPDSDGDGLRDGEEDLDGDAVVDVGETDPTRSDTDGGGTPDGQERLDGTDPLRGADDLERDHDQDGLISRAELSVGIDPNDADTDDDGVLDGAERDWDLDTDDDGLLNAEDADSDNDGLPDGLETGIVQASPATDLRRGRFIPDNDPESHTDPLRADSDGAGINDGGEDLNRDGAVSFGETDPNDPDDDAGGPLDTDGDGLSDLAEDAERLDPFDADTDDDGLPDGAEPNFNLDQDQDGLINALDPDSDDDGLPDGLEAGVSVAHPDTDLDRGNFIADTDPQSRTSPLLPDSDRGGLLDGLEDVNRNGRVDPNETDPNDKDDDASPDRDGDGLPDAVEAFAGSDPEDGDSDDDGVSDGDEGLEDSDGDGIVDAMDPDSDDDGVLDGTERSVRVPHPDTDRDAGNFRPDADPETSTDPRNPDTDGDGLEDGEEDLDADGRVDDGETDPNVPDLLPDVGVDAAPEDAGVPDATVIEDAAIDAEPDFEAPPIDRDNDGLSDEDEEAIGTDPFDADTDDDGVGDAEDGRADTDQDGLIDALDPDSDNDGLPDGLELGVTAPIRGTSLAAGNFIADQDPETSTDPKLADTDRGGLADGVEDRNKNGRVDGGEGDPNDASDDRREPPPPPPLHLRGGGCSQAASHGGVWALALLLLVCLRRRAGLLVLLLAVLPAPDAQAWQVNRFEPRVGNEGVITTEAAAVGHHLQWRLGTTLHHQANALVGEDEQGRIASRLSESLTMLEVSGAFSLYGRLELGLALPFAANALGESTEGVGFDEAGVADPRLLLKATLLPRKPGRAISLGIGVPLSLPLGDEDLMLGDGEASATPSLLFDAKVSRVYLAMNLGYRLREKQVIHDVELGNEMRYRAGARVDLPYGVAVSGALDGATLAEDLFSSAAVSPLDLLFSVRLRTLGCITLMAGGGAGIVGGAGAPEWRAFGGLGRVCENGVAPPRPAAPTPTLADQDADGVPDAQDGCPGQKEDIDDYEDRDGCPDPDNDGDGLPDGRDRCPNDPEDRDGFQDADGCPDLDDDDDGVPDAKDRCLRQKEDIDGVEDEDGCPEADPKPLAPVDPYKEPAPATKPTAVVGVASLHGDIIVVEKRVRFTPRTNRLTNQAREVLGDVANLIIANPTLTRVRIEGHTDSVGAEQFNLRVSRTRAHLVRGYLMQLGVGADRLEAVGHGEAMPVESNRSREGRRANRRIEFHVVKRAP